MEESKSRGKNDIFYLLLVVLTLITMVMGITFTYYALVQSEEKDSTRLQTGTLAIDYIDGQSIGEFLFAPINTPDFNDNHSVYRKKFAVTSSGTLDQTLDIYIDVTNNTFSNRALHYSIYLDDGTKLGTGEIPSEGKILLAKEVDLKSGDTKNFVMLVWLQENKQNQDGEIGKTFTGKFDITANQVKYE